VDKLRPPALDHYEVGLGRLNGRENGWVASKRHHQRDFRGGVQYDIGAA
jgi:hypothetical protein